MNAILIKKVHLAKLPEISPTLARDLEIATVLLEAMAILRS